MLPTRTGALPQVEGAKIQHQYGTGGTEPPTGAQAIQERACQQHPDQLWPLVAPIQTGRSQAQRDAQDRAEVGAYGTDGVARGDALGTPGGGL